MNKILCQILILTVVSNSYSQYKSLLSANNEGRVLSSVFSSNRLAGQLSAAYSSSNVNNLQNPASYADASLTAIEVGTYGENGSYDFKDSTKTSGGVGLSHFTFLLPLTSGKSGMGLGFYKNATTDYGYRVTGIDPIFGTVNNSSSGSGNTYNAFIGTGFRFNKLKIGASIMADFGNVNYRSDYLFKDSLKLPVIRELTSVSQLGFSYNAGIQYEIDISKTKQVLLGAYYHGVLFKNGNTQFVQQNIYNKGLFSEQNITISDTTIDVDLPSSSKIGCGVSYIMNRSLLVGAEFNYSNYSGFKNRLDTSNLRNAWYFQLGLEFKPFLNRNINNRSYFNRITYRVGGILGKNEQSFTGSINDFRIMGGVTFPILSRSLGYLTTGLEFQQRNNNGVHQISESILSFRLILTFADKWFIRSKFD